jgi:hypothetical protein
LGSARATAVSNTVGEPGGSPAATHSRQVKKIMRLEARAQRLLTRYENTLAAATRAKGQAHLLLDQAHSIECVLTGTQRGELYRARREAMRGEAAVRSAASDQPAVTPSD